MATTHPKATRRAPLEHPESEAVVEEVIEALLEPDRAHHDEIGRTRNGESGQAPGHISPREQPAAPLDIETVDE